MSPRYALGGLVLESAVALPEVPESPGEVATCSLELAPAAPADEWPDAEGWVRVGRVPGGHALDFSGLARFEVNAAGDRIRCTPAPDIPDETIRHLILDHVLPRLLALRGVQVLHASAVVTPAGVIGFVGATGWGKSSLATSLGLEGLPLLSDDALILETVDGDAWVRGTYPGVRLWPHDVMELLGDAEGAPVAHYTLKIRFGPGTAGALSFRGGALPLHRLYVLEPPELADGDGGGEGDDDAIAIAPLSAHEAFLALSRHTFRLELADAAQHRDGFERLTRSPALARTSSLRFPRTRAVMPALYRALLADGVP